MRKIVFIQLRTSILILASLFRVWGQDNYFPDRVASSPTAAGLISAIEFPVDLSSGKPSISIPLYTIERDGVQVPISISYNAQGIKVNQVAGYAGLNWNFNVGGSVSRLVNGIQDEHLRGYMSGNWDISNIMDVCSSSSINVDEDECRSYMLKAEHPDFDKIDVKPDEFYFQFGEYSGKFFFDQVSSQFVFQTKQDLAVEYYSGSGGIIGFRFTTPHGIKYYFGVESEFDNSPVLEKRVTSGILHSNNMSSPLPLPSGEFEHHSLWPIRRIITPNGQEINFHYSSPYSQAYNTKGGEWLDRDNESGNLINNVRIEQHRITQPLLESIDFGVGKVNISSWDGTRLDYLSPSFGIDTAVALGSIKVVDQNGNQIKKYNFDYDHYSTTESLPYYVAGTNYEEGVRKRLRLKSVQEEGKDEGLLPPYHFDYNGNFLPSLYNTGQDFWGYYNGQQNGNFVKKGTAEPDKNRNVNPALSSVGILNKITYPPGGYTELTFESNRGKSLNHNDIDSYLDTDPRNVMISKKASQPGDPPNPYWDGSQGKYILIFEVDQEPIGLVDLYMNLPDPCPTTGNTSPDCPYLVYLDGNPLPNVTYTTISKTNLSVGTHTLVVQPNQPVSDPENDHFNVRLSWNVTVSLAGNEFFMGGLRVRSVTSYDFTDELLFKKDYYYKLGRSISLPSFIENQYINNVTLLCTNGNQFGNVELVGSGYEFPNYAEVYEDNFRTLVQELPDGSSVPPYSKVVSRFDNLVRPDNEFYLQPYPPPNDLQFQMNKLVSKTYYNEEGVVKIEEYKYLNESEDINNYYQQDHILGISGFRNLTCDNPDTLNVQSLDPGTYKLYHGLDQVRYLKETTYFENTGATIITKRDFDSEEHSQLTRTTVYDGFDSDDILITEYYYANDTIGQTGSGEYLGADFFLNKLKKDSSLHRPAIPLITKSYRSQDNGLTKQLVSISQLLFDNFGSIISVSEQMSAKGEEPLESVFKITRRNDKGKPLEVIGRDSVTICFIWGYGGELLIGKVSGISYDDIAAEAENLSDFSDSDIDSCKPSEACSESTLRARIQLFISSHPEVLASFVTFDPLVGVTSTIDSNGVITTYRYDEFNRRKSVLDQDGNILSQNEYHYKDQ